jgi:hypothetical protein
MSWRSCLTVAAILFSSNLLADGQTASPSQEAAKSAIWREYGLTGTQTVQQGELSATIYRTKDATGALGAWEWLRSPQGRACNLAAFCNQDGKRTVVSDYNAVIAFEGAVPTKEQVDAMLQALPDRRQSSLPAVLTFLPEQGLVPNSARYLLGPTTLAVFAPELASKNIGLDRGGEGQVANYRLNKTAAPMRLALFYYPTPEMARIYTAELRKDANLHVRRAGVLVALTLPPATPEASDTLLGRVRYNAKVTWNDVPPPSPIKPLYQLLLNIMYMSIALSLLCLVAGLIYAGMRIYRRRYGTLEADEAMTTLRLTGE